MDVIKQGRRTSKAFVPYQLLGVDAAIRLAKRDVALARDFSESVIDRHRLKIPAQLLLALESLEQRLEVTRPEALRTFALDYLVEQRRPIFHRLRENLQQVPFFVAIDEDAEFAQLLHIFVDVSDALLDGVVVSAGHAQELDAVVAQLRHSVHDVVSRDGNVLAARSLIELEILVDLGFLLAFRRLVERELDAAISVGDDLRHQRRVLGRDGLVVEGNQLLEPEYVGIVLHPLVHRAELDVADAVIHILETDAVGVATTREGNESRHEQALVVLAFYEAVDRFTVRLDPGDDDFAILVGQRFWCIRRLRAALYRQLERSPRIIDPERDVLDAVAVLVHVGRDVAVRPQRSGENDSDFVLDDHVAGTITRTGLGPAISYDFVAKNLAIKLRGLLCIPDVELDEIRPVDREGVGDLLRCRKCRGSHDFSGSTRCECAAFLH